MQSDNNIIKERDMKKNNLNQSKEREREIKWLIIYFIEKKNIFTRLIRKKKQLPPFLYLKMGKISISSLFSVIVVVASIYIHI
jgi:lipopolysaccharide biosynthesis protein